MKVLVDDGKLVAGTVAVTMLVAWLVVDMISVAGLTVVVTTELAAKLCVVLIGVDKDASEVDDDVMVGIVVVVLIDVGFVVTVVLKVSDENDADVVAVSFVAGVEVAVATKVIVVDCTNAGRTIIVPIMLG